MQNKSYRVPNSTLLQYDALSHEAVDAITSQFYDSYGPLSSSHGERGLQASREEIKYHLSYLRPTLETGYIQSYVEYLRWLSDVFLARKRPVEQLEVVLGWLGDYFVKMLEQDGDVIKSALDDAIAESKKTSDLPEENNKFLPEVLSFELALLKGDRAMAIAIVEQLYKSGISVVEIEVLLIEAAMYEIGLKWQKNQVSVAQEHLASATASTVMAELFSNSHMSRPNGKKAILACVESNLHMLGLSMISDALQLDGWEVQFLGANTPTASLIEHIGVNKPDMVGVSVAFSSQVSAARDVFAGVRSIFPKNCPYLIVGGNAVNRYPELFKLIGADESAKNAMAVAAKLN